MNILAKDVKKGAKIELFNKVLVLLDDSCDASGTFSGKFVSLNTNECEALVTPNTKLKTVK